MSHNSELITISDVKLSIEHLIEVICQLDEHNRIQVAKALLKTQMDHNLSNLITQLANTPPSDSISDNDIQSEINAVRKNN